MRSPLNTLFGRMAMLSAAVLLGMQLCWFVMRGMGAVPCGKTSSHFGDRISIHGAHQWSSFWASYDVKGGFAYTVVQFPA